MAQPIAPCKDCPEREVGCHAKCEKYKGYVAQMDVIRGNRATALESFFKASCSERTRRKMMKKGKGRF